jgi:hypothetical protein
MVQLFVTLAEADMFDVAVLDPSATPVLSAPRQIAENTFNLNT